jgi:hypothetical protein
MKTYRPILAMIVFLGLAFLMDYLLDFILSGQTGYLVSPLAFYWFSLLCQLILGALILLLIYYTLRKEWLTHEAAITFVVVGGIILLYTPLWITFTELFPNTMDSIYLQSPDFKMPAFWARSFFTLAGIIVIVTGVYGLLPKPKKNRK